MQEIQVESYIDDNDVDILLEPGTAANKLEDIAPLSPNITERSDSVDSIRGGKDYVSFGI